MCKIKQIVPNCTINYRNNYKRSGRGSSSRGNAWWCCCGLLISIAFLLLLQTTQAARLTANVSNAKGLRQSKASTDGSGASGQRAANNVNEALTARTAAIAGSAGIADGTTTMTATTMTATSTLKETATTAETINDMLGQQQQQQLQQKRGAAGAETRQKTSAANVASKYEIRAVAGEPNYKSVNLTWEVEFVPAVSGNSIAAADTPTSNEAIGGLMTNASTVAAASEVEPPPSAFQIFYCEMQAFGPQRCRAKLVNNTMANRQSQANDHQVRQFQAVIDNLRMATRYSFHIRAQKERTSLRADGARAEFNNEIESELRSGAFKGETIVIPTKGFSAHATQCLPHASEIEVETGPYFGGRIVVDGGSCGIKGDPDDAADKYTMRIDHKACGSMVKPQTNTVETFVTVQENLGIFTHSTRRFVVVCSYQSGMQTVRASFTVPGKNGLAAPIVEHNDPFIPDDPRIGRDMRRLRYVSKNELVLKDSPLNRVDSLAAEPAEPSALLANAPSAPESAVVHELPAQHAAADNAELSAPETEPQLTNYARLVLNQNDPSHSNWLLDAHSAVKVKSNAAGHGGNDEPDVAAATLHYITANLGSVLVTVSVSVIIISICIIVIQRYAQHGQHLRLKASQQQQSLRLSTSAKAPAHSHQVPPKTLPYVLQQQHQHHLGSL